MSKFTDRLWQELLRDHRTQLEQISRPAAAGRRLALPRRLIAGTSVGLAGAGTAIALAIGAANSTPAFAVTKHRDGTISVTINKLSGVAGANQRLQQLRVRAVAVPVVAGCEGAPPPMVHAIMLARAAAVNGGTVRIDPKQIPAGKSLVLAAGGGQVNVAQLHRGKAWTAPSCYRGVVGPVACSAGPPPGFRTNTTDTTGTDTAPAPPTNTNTTTGTTTTGTTTGPVRPGRPWTVSCAAPPPCVVLPPAAGSGSTNTTTTGTATAPPPKTATTDTNTAGTSTAPGGPMTRRFFGCAPPPCAQAQVVPGGKAGAALRKQVIANQLMLRRQLTAARAALAKARAAAAKTKTH
jgi:hypothetical protein